MGGKHKQAQRTKNNARPSSSGRSAERLSSTTLPQFSNVKDIGLISLGLPLLKTEEHDSTIDSNFQVLFKKMNKKDCTTKLKALQEFAELVSRSDVGAVQEILVIWARLYGALSTDSDHRVREAVQNAHYQVVLKDKKIIAPHLKQLIGPWFTSQYDTYAPAASAATKSFSATFPTCKAQECIVFCQREILNHICENLTDKNAINSKKPSIEEVEAKIERTIVASLQGYSMYLSTLTAEQIRNNIECNNTIINSSEFITLAVFDAPQIRASWFKVLTRICKKAHFLLDHNRSQIVPKVLGSLDEDDPAVVPFVWEAALQLINIIEEWWKFVHVEKQFFSKLWTVLRKGGQGSATIIFPNFLTILSRLPPGTDVISFYEKFFQNLCIGLELKSVEASKSESSVIVSTLVECLQYVIMVNKSNTSLCEKIMKCHMLPIIERNFMESKPYRKTMFLQTARLVLYWSRNNEQENYPRYLEYFWTNIKVIFVNVSLHLENDYNTSVASGLAKNQFDFVTFLKNPEKNTKLAKVKFSYQDNIVNKPQTKSEDCSPSHELYFDDLNSIVYGILKTFITLIEQKQCKVLFEPLVSFVQLFEGYEFFKGLTKVISDNSENVQEESLVIIYTKLLRNWLKSPELSSKIVVDLLFVLLKYMDAEEKYFVLESLEEIPDEMFGLCLTYTLSEPFSQDPVVQKWLLNEKVNDYFIMMTEKSLIKNCDEQFKCILQLSFMESQHGELLVSDDTVMEIMRKLEEPLLNSSEFSSTLESCATLASYVLSALYNCDESVPTSRGVNLALALFSFYCNSCSNEETPYKDIVDNVNSSWQNTVQALTRCLSKDEFESLIKKVANIIETAFLKCQGDVISDHLVKVMVGLINTIFTYRPLMVAEVFDVFFSPNFFAAWKEKLIELCIFSEYLNGTLCCPFEQHVKKLKKENEQNDVENAVKYFSWSLIKLRVLSNDIQHLVFDEENCESGCEANNRIFDAIDSNAEVLTDLLYDLTLAQSFLQGYEMVKSYWDIKIISELISIEIKKIIQKPEQLKPILIKKLTLESWLWAKAVLILHSELCPSSLIETYQDYFNYLSSSDYVNQLHLTQTFGRHLNFDCVENTIGTSGRPLILRSLLSCARDGIDVQIAEVFEKIEKLREKDIPTFLYERSNKSSWSDIEEIIEVVRLFSELISTQFECFSRRHWDFGIISLVSWTTNCFKQRNDYENEQFQAFVVALSSFYLNVSNKMKELKIENPKNTYVCEWEDLFQNDIQTNLVQLWLYLAEQFEEKGNEIPLTYQPFLQEFGKVISNFNHQLIFSRDDAIPNWSKFLRRSCSLLISPVTLLQLWGYKMLQILIPGIVDIDTAAINTNAPHEKGLVLGQFNEVLIQTNQIVDDLLINFKLGEDSCEVKSFTDAFTHVFGYLLLWLVLLELCEKSSSELRYQYADWLKKDNLFKSLLNNLFKLMPTKVLHCSEGKSKGCVELFEKEPSLDFKVSEPFTSERLEHIVCRIYTLCLSQLPVMVRQWWSETDTKVAQIVEKVTEFYVSPQLCNQELKDLTNHETKFKNLVIKVMPSVREVVAIYTVDEAQMELVITLPATYPLGGPDVHCSKQIGGTSHKQWLMQLKKCLLHQNGRIWDGLSLWNSNLDKKFDGIEECYICFAVLHPGTYQLPKLSCQTCRKKFHSACLYKWFSTSNNSTCPICRNLF